MRCDVMSGEEFVGQSKAAQVKMGSGHRIHGLLVLGAGAGNFLSA